MSYCSFVGIYYNCVCANVMNSARMQFSSVNCDYGEVFGTERERN